MLDFKKLGSYISFQSIIAGLWLLCSCYLFFEKQDTQEWLLCFLLAAHNIKDDLVERLRNSTKVDFSNDNR